MLSLACMTCCFIADALLVWGWRVPFLLAIFTLVAATVLRYNMPGKGRAVQISSVYICCTHSLQGMTAVTK